VICSPLQVCDIELQAGETVQDVLVGDTVRWKVEPATSGNADGQTVHLIVKPAEPALETSMVVTTSRRTYHIELKSDETQFMPRVGFDYPEDVNASIAALGQQMQASVVPGAGVPADELDFKFSADGNAPWRPTRIYSDGVKTYIQFPSALTGQDAPVLFVIDGGQNRIVNYRMEGTMMVVDYRIDQAILISGVGRSQRKITIKREG
jgi:P-type conjugative transfer protein TrbG